MLDLSESKQPHKTLTDKNNGLSAAQEVLYAEDYRKADHTTDQDKTTQQDKNKKSDK